MRVAMRARRLGSVRAPCLSRVSWSFEGVEDRFDSLADRGEPGAGVGLVLAGGSDDGCSELGGGVFEALAGVAFVADDDGFAASGGAGDELEGDVALGAVGGRELDGAWGAVWCEQGVEAHAPEAAGVGGAIPIRAGLCESAAAGGFDASAALHWGGVKEQNVVAETGALGGEHAREPLDRLAQLDAALMEARLGRQQLEQVTELALGRPKKPPIGGDSHRGLGDSERDDLGVCELPPRVVAWLGQEIVSRAINTDTEKVEVGVHRGPLGRRCLMDTADFDLPFHTPDTTTPTPLTTGVSVESTI